MELIRTVDQGWGRRRVMLAIALITVTIVVAIGLYSQQINNQIPDFAPL